GQEGGRRAARLGFQGDRAHRQAGRDPFWREPAKDPFWQDHAATVALAGQGRRDHFGYLDARQPGHSGPVETGGGVSLIKNEDLIASVADALQFMSYYHPVDFIRALGLAYEMEQSPAARDAIAQILTNSRMCAEGKRPI